MKDESEVNGAKRKKAASKDVCLRFGLLPSITGLSAHCLPAYCLLHPSAFILHP
jgi:hypothetical protein